MKLTKHQQEILLQVLQALDVNKRVVLQGSAGVGKTFLVNEILRRIGTNHRKSIYLTAPTNKALAVLREKTTIEGNIVFSTVHSALRLKRRFGKKTGEVFFRQEYSANNPPFKNCRLAIIDEASMLNHLLLDYLSLMDFPILFIGDEKQLNPVGEDDSPVFYKNWKTLELTEIIRQGNNNPIIDLSRNIPLIFKKKPKVIEGAGYIYRNDRNKVISKLAEVNGTDELKYIAWTNDEVDTMNFSVRQAIYGQPNMLEKGETMIFNAPYGNIYTNQEVKIEKLHIGNTKIPIRNGDSRKVELKTYLVNEEILVVHEESLNKFRRVRSMVKDRCKREEDWRPYYDFTERFADFKYNHAITVHKSQGSTYRDVVMNVANMNKNYNQKEKQRLFYTAITRASNLLILYRV